MPVGVEIGKPERILVIALDWDGNGFVSQGEKARALSIPFVEIIFQRTIKDLCCGGEITGLDV